MTDKQTTTNNNNNCMGLRHGIWTWWQQKFAKLRPLARPCLSLCQHIP